MKLVVLVVMVMVKMGLEEEVSKRLTKVRSHVLVCVPEYSSSLWPHPPGEHSDADGEEEVSEVEEEADVTAAKLSKKQEVRTSSIWSDKMGWFGVVVPAS